MSTILTNAITTASNIIASGPAVITGDAAHDATAIANFHAARRVLDAAMDAYMRRGGHHDNATLQEAKTKRDAIRASAHAMQVRFARLNLGEEG